MTPERMENDFLEEKVTKKANQLKDALLRELGVESEDLKNFSSFTRFLHSPRDPSNLAVIRMLYGFLMIIDVHHERGLSSADNRWGNPAECRFPLFDSWRPLPLEWMIILYLTMILGGLGIMLGYRYRLSCLAFLLPYWYIFLLDKSHWNNHSYLFGLIGIQLMLSGANRCWSLDGRRKAELKYTQVPLWNYALLRGQIFLVYFIAGLKKTNLDWIGGYSMEKLGYHWVFDGFRLFLSDDQITFFVVHLGGFLLDLTVGFFMLMDFSRPYAFLFCAMFNLMNSRMFSIGMFPYVMIAVMPIFCSSDWPVKLLSPYRCWMGCRDNLMPSPECIYPENKEAQEKKIEGKSLNKNVRFRHKVRTVAICSYFALQFFLPYSHFVTKGYNTWTQGLYGYSWDMMVHNWRYVHANVRVLDKSTHRLYHLDPEAWTRSHRWTHHADMVKQFAHCIRDRMSQRHRMKNVEVFIDVWLSLNRRFIQRVYDPTVDIVSAKWSPFRDVTWVLPLQKELTEWRENLVEMEERIFNQSENADVLFVADFPGFHLVNYVNDRLSNASLEVLKGSVELFIEPNHTMELREGQTVMIPSGKYHRVSPLKYSPACYKYEYNVNRTDVTPAENQPQDFLQAAKCPARTSMNKQIQLKEAACEGPCWRNFHTEVKKKFDVWQKSMVLIGRALYSILTQQPMSVEKGRVPTVPM